MSAFACSVSGTGEHIMRQLVARSCVRKLRKQNSTEEEAQVIERLLKKFQKKEGPDAAAGLIAVVAAQRSKFIFAWGHTTPSMAIGYITNKRKKSKVSSCVFCYVPFVNFLCPQRSLYHAWLKRQAYLATWYLSKIV